MGQLLLIKLNALKKAICYHQNTEIKMNGDMVMTKFLQPCLSKRQTKRKSSAT